MSMFPLKRRVKSRMKLDKRLSRFHLIPLGLSLILLLVYTAGMGTIYFVKGDQAAKSLSIDFSYDSDKAAEYAYLGTVSETLTSMMELAGNKDKTLDRVCYIDSLSGVSELRSALSEILDILNEVVKEGEESFANRNSTDALIASLSEQMKAVSGFKEGLSDEKAFANRREKKTLKTLEEDCGKLLDAYQTFLDVDADPDKELLTDGRLNRVEAYARSLSSYVTGLADRQLHAAAVFEKADDLMVSVSDVLTGEIYTLSDTFKGLSESDREAFVSAVNDNTDMILLLTAIDKRMAETDENSIAYAASIVSDNNTSFSQRLRLSRDVAENRKHLKEAVTDASYVILSDSLVGSVTSADGRLLFSALPDTSDQMTDAFKNLVGTGSFSDFQGADVYTRLILDCYKEELFPELSYSALSGFSSDEGKDLTLTIDASLQESMYQYMLDHKVVGDVLCVDYTSGRTLCMASTENLNISLRNTSPGSTMKVVTLFLLEASGVDPSSVWFSCEGRYGHVTCTSGGKDLTHGYINGVTAIGESCNCWFAQAIERYLMTNGVIKDSVCEILTDLGYQVTTDQGEKTETKKIGKINRDKSVVNFDPQNKTTSLWNLIGETTVEMSPIDMVELVGLFTGSGIAEETYLVEEDAGGGIDLSAEYGDAFSRALSIWKKGFQERVEKEMTKTERSGFTYSNLPQTITAAKTGTTQISNDNDQQRLLLGFSEEKGIAFYIVINNYRVNGTEVEGQDVTVADIASYLFEQLLTGEDLNE